jgi:hypothetical protein
VLPASTTFRKSSFVHKFAVAMVLKSSKLYSGASQVAFFILSFIDNRGLC